MSRGGAAPATFATPYREYRPHPALAPFVACYWRYRQPREGPLPTRDEAVVPDACMDILVDLERERTLLVGAMTRPLIVRREHASDLVGVRFRPGAARIFADVPADEMTDRTVDLDEIVGPAARPLGERMLHARGEAPATEALDAFLLPRLRRVHARERRLLAATRMLAERRGGVGIDALAGGVGVGRRQLERAFRAWVGLGPKATARVLRFQAARTRLLERSPGSLASIALSAGYHDQAHFTNEFRALAGETPRAFRLRRLGASQP